MMLLRISFACQPTSSSEAARGPDRPTDRPTEQPYDNNHSAAADAAADAAAVFTVTAAAAVPNRHRVVVAVLWCFGRHDACRIPRLTEKGELKLQAVSL